MNCAIDFVKSAIEVFEGVTGGAWAQDRGVIHFVALWLVNYVRGPMGKCLCIPGLPILHPLPILYICVIYLPESARGRVE